MHGTRARAIRPMAEAAAARKASVVRSTLARRRAAEVSRALEAAAASAAVRTTSGRTLATDPVYMARLRAPFASAVAGLAPEMAHRFEMALADYADGRMSAEAWMRVTAPFWAEEQHRLGAENVDKERSVASAEDWD